MTDAPPYNLPDRIDDEAQLEEVMTRPSPGLVEAAIRWEGDLIILGAGGKMGPTMAMLASRAMQAAGVDGRVIAVSRFTDGSLHQRLESAGVTTISCDLLDDAALAALPSAERVIHLAVRKFGATQDPAFTWAMNVYLPGLVAERFAGSRIVTLSTGNVYPLSPIEGEGPAESDPLGPVGEYAQTSVGRERIFTYMSQRDGTPVAIVRLNYAIDLRYGVLLDIARKIWTGEPIDLTMGYVNVIWQGDANEIILRCLDRAASPPFILNVTGSKLRVRDLGTELGRLLGKTPVFAGAEASTALLSNAARCRELMGPPRVPIETMLEWVANWVRIDGPTLSKPTHFQTRDGAF